MNTLEIVQLLQSDLYTAPTFKGVFPLDRIPTTVFQKPASLIINCSPVSQPGSHWVALFLPANNQPLEYFDSIGRPPLKREIGTVIKNNAIDWLHSNKRLQSPFATTCGQYCILYIQHRCRGESMQQFLNHFSKENLTDNDNLVTEIVNDLFKISLQPLDLSFFN